MREQAVKKDTCPISSLYSTQELGHIAIQCPEERFHVNQETHLVEIEESHRNAGYGEIIVTPLMECAMPLIRYKPGDLVSPGSTRCRCGHQHQILDEILGRSTDLYITASGITVTPNYWNNFVVAKELQGKINQYQVVYGKAGVVRFRIVRTKTYDNEAESFIRDKLRLNFHDDFHPLFEYPDHIPHAHSGKFQTVVTER